jgi:hypothetical protein
MTEESLAQTVPVTFKKEKPASSPRPPTPGPGPSKKGKEKEHTFDNLTKRWHSFEEFKESSRRDNSVYPVSYFPETLGLEDVGASTTENYMAFLQHAIGSRLESLLLSQN